MNQEVVIIILIIVTTTNSINLKILTSKTLKIQHNLIIINTMVKRNSCKKKQKLIINFLKKKKLSKIGLNQKKKILRKYKKKL